MVARTHSETQGRLPPTKRITASPFDPLVKALFPKLAARTPRFVTPNMITISGVVASMVGGTALVLSRWWPGLLLLAAALVLFNWVADTLDGVLARQRDQCTRLGDFLDHVFDAVTVTAFILGSAFSGYSHPEIPLVLGMVFLLCFAITYKGEQVTGIYELLALGPTEVRFALIATYLATYFLREPLVTLGGMDLRILDLVAAFSTLWALIYAIILLRRYGRWVLESKK